MIEENDLEFGQKLGTGTSAKVFRGIYKGTDVAIKLFKSVAEDQLDDFKLANKRVILQHYRLDESLPLITFIGRLVREKGADLLPDLIRRVLYSGMRVSFATYLDAYSVDPEMECQDEDIRNVSKARWKRT